MFPWRPRTTVAATTVLCLGLVLAPAEAGAVLSDPIAPTTTAVTGSNPGVGALQLSAVVSSEAPPSTTAVVVFEVDGRTPVAVPLGRSVIVGQQGDRPAPDAATAVVGFTGLDPRGTFHATATYVPDEGGGAEGSAVEVTTTLTRTVDESSTALRATARGRAVELLFSVEAYPPDAVLGSLEVVDRAERRSVVRRTGVRSGRTSFMTLRGVSRGVHRYRATFTPAPRLRESLTGSVATSQVAVGRRDQLDVTSRSPSTTSAVRPVSERVSCSSYGSQIAT